MQFPLRGGGEGALSAEEFKPPNIYRTTLGTPVGREKRREL